MDYASWLAFAEKQLEGNKQKDPFIDAKVDANFLLQFVTGHSNSFILAFSETKLSIQQLEKLNSLLRRRLKNEPIAYILGEQPFWTLNLSVSSDTLIPRADTEILVENALRCSEERVLSSDFDGELKILDLGTGTGAIAIALAKELGSRSKKLFKLSVVGVDLIENAVNLAINNAKRNNADNVHFYQSNWFEQLGEQRFDIIVSNPPYIDKQDPHLQLGDVRFEPLSALVSAEQGYADLRHIISNAPMYLKTNGWLLVEHGWKQGEKVRSFFKENIWHNVVSCMDYNQNERITLAKLKKGEND